VMDSPNEYGIPKDAGVFTGTGGNFINWKITFDKI
jgi:hypothetical protein